MPRTIDSLREELGLLPEEVASYGHTKAKIHLDALKRLDAKPDGKMILVTAISPTPAGEGKTTTTIGVGDALRSIGKNTVICVREPSLGPTFGVKGGGTGGGKARAIPADELNLHFTGDFHAITSAHNLLTALAEAHIHHGNEAGFATHGMTWNRVLDVTDRVLRNMVTGLGGKSNGIPRENGFAITAASEIMALVAGSRSLEDLQSKLGQLIIGHKNDKTPITAKDVEAVGAMTALLRDALHPNLIQTESGTPLLAHMGPFGNLATGHNSVASDEMGLKLSDYMITEAGFGSDLGFEKFCHIVVPQLGRSPDAVVVVATIRGIKAHSPTIARLVPGRPLPKELTEENLEAVRGGAENLRAHIENVRQFGLPVVVAVNRFGTDTDAEVELVAKLAKEFGAESSEVSDVFSKGAEGGVAVAEKLVEVIDKGEAKFKPLYTAENTLEEKIAAVCTGVYRASDVAYSRKAKRKLDEAQAGGFGHLPLCVAKTPFSFSHDGTLRGAPSDYTFEIDDVDVAAGAGFIRVYSGGILVMPGLSKRPTALDMKVGPDGAITGMKL